MAGVSWTGVRRGAVIFAAVLALALNVLVPPGFMAGGPEAGLVLCTGHGPVQIASDLGGLDKASGSHGSKSSGDGPCAFTGHGAAPTLAVSPVLTSTSAIWIPFVEPLRQALITALPLAAPPPPSQAPPAVPV